jgi:hypothetical protein
VTELAHIACFGLRLFSTQNSYEVDMTDLVDTSLKTRYEVDTIDYNSSRRHLFFDYEKQVRSGHDRR